MNKLLLLLFICAEAVAMKRFMPDNSFFIYF